jgi:hypothetical protein
MARPTAAEIMVRGPAEPTGYSGVAATLNALFDWPGGRVIDRRQVERWHARRTRNQMGQVPPSPARIRRKVPRTAPRVLFDVQAWVDWARAGVPGPRNKGWTVPAEHRS